MDLKIKIDDEVYGHFLNNKYGRADIIAVHAALNNAVRYDYAISHEAVRMILAKYHLGESRMAEELNELPPVTQNSREWIPISEGLPKEGKTVIASTDYGVYPEARYTKENGWEWAYEAGADYWTEIKGITAWMPLPAKYKPQKSESKHYVERDSDAYRCWCNTCEFKHLESECLGCAEYDEYDNLIDLRNYKKEKSDD